MQPPGCCVVHHHVLMLVLSCSSFTGCLSPVVLNTNYVCWCLTSTTVLHRLTCWNSASVALTVISALQHMATSLFRERACAFHCLVDLLTCLVSKTPALNCTKSCAGWDCSIRQCKSDVSIANTAYLWSDLHTSHFLPDCLLPVSSRKLCRCQVHSVKDHWVTTVSHFIFCWNQSLRPWSETRRKSERLKTGFRPSSD